jgi:flagellar protein FlgJ
MTPVVSPTPGVTPAGTPAKTDREKLSETARQFEAIFVRHMLAAARKTDFGSDLFGSEALGTFREMQDDRFAEITAQTGSLGLATLIEAQLARLLPTAAGTAKSEG